MRTHRPVHPGEILAEDLEALGIPPTALAKLLQVPANRFTQLVTGKRNVTADTALRLGHYFGTSPEFWMNLQTNYDLALAEANKTTAQLPTLSAA